MDKHSEYLLNWAEKLKSSGKPMRVKLWQVNFVTSNPDETVLLYTAKQVSKPMDTTKIASIRFAGEIVLDD